MNGSALSLSLFHKYVILMWVYADIYSTGNRKAQAGYPEFEDFLLLLVGYFLSKLALNTLTPCWCRLLCNYDALNICYFPTLCKILWFFLIVVVVWARSLAGIWGADRRESLNERLALGRNTWTNTTESLLCSFFTSQSRKTEKRLDFDFWNMNSLFLNQPCLLLNQPEMYFQALLRLKNRKQRKI